ncbi:uncharacterized protein LOC123273336 [Cotesia glomerata]|uniref:uncharacterized protein LOC123273336 n=1 Tax=Cotesia glomerata TaxID=32391 RepID=UPI001D022154|nr:uncharacterized protein LOC123273336 [Cotesia glomerata]
MVDRGEPRLINRRRRRPALSSIESLPDRIFDNHRFRYGRKLKDGKRRLICSNAESDACGAQGTLTPPDDFAYVQNKREHTHEPDEDANRKATFLCALYTATVKQFRKLEKVYSDIALLNQESAHDLTFEAVKFKMQSWRQHRKFPILHTVSDFDETLKTEVYENICRHNEGKIEVEFLQDVQNEYTHIMFADKELMNKLPIDKLLVQSTVKILPDNLDAVQLISISTHFADHIFPIAWIPVMVKTTDSCRELMEKLQLLKPNWQPAKILHDFDDDLCKSFAEQFPNAIQRGTFSSHCMIMMEKADQFNLNIRDGPTALILSKIIALSLLPAQKIKNNFCLVVQSLDNVQRETFRALLQYYVTHWINGVGVNNYSFFKKKYSLLNNSQMIIRHMNNHLQNDRTGWNFLDYRSNLKNDFEG